MNVAFADSPAVVINEIAWMGTTASANDEWIELYNTTDSEINLEGWTLKGSDGLPNLLLSGSIPAQGFYLIERTDDETVPGIKADLIATFGSGSGMGLSNDPGETLELRNGSFLIDSATWTKAEPGNPLTKQTMERKNANGPANDPNNWQTSQNPGGTPKAPNSSGAPSQETPPQDSQSSDGAIDGKTTSSDISAANQPPKAIAGSDVIALANQQITFDASLSSDPEDDTLSYLWNFGDGTTSDQQTTTHLYQYPGTYIAVLKVSDGENTNSDTLTVAIYPNTVIISEFLPSPNGSDEENEWIEIFNNSAQIINLSGWQIDDEENGSKSFVFPANTLIAGYQYLVLGRPATKISLNNNKDSVRLLYPNGQLAQEIQYKNAKEEKSVALSGSGEYLWTTIPTPGAPNLINSDKQNSQVITNQAEAKDYLAQSNNNIVSGQIYYSQNPSENTPSVIIPDSHLSESSEALDKTLISMGKNNNNNVENLSKTTGKNIGQTKPQSQDANFLEQIYHSRNSSFVIIILLISGLGLIAGWAIIKARKRLKH